MSRDRIIERDALDPARVADVDVVLADIIAGTLWQRLFPTPPDVKELRWPDNVPRRIRSRYMGCAMEMLRLVRQHQFAAAVGGE